MNRRNLLKVIGISAVGVATVPLWLNAWSTEDLPQDSLELNEEQKLMLSEIVDTIIPAGEIPGAKDLEVDKFIQEMVAACFEEDVQKQFLAGFNDLKSLAKDKFDQPFTKLSDKERITLLETMSAFDDQEKKFNFVAFIKELTVTGYMNTRYVMENLLEYEFIPARFDGSFPVEKTVYSNT